MAEPNDPQIANVDQTDNSAVVEFKGEPDEVIYPARLLRAAKDLANIMHEGDEDAESHR